MSQIHGDPRLGVEKCERCGNDTNGVTTMSMFNTQTICLTCKSAEKLHPTYSQAHEADIAAIRSGNYNFGGIGLPPDLIGGGHHLLE